MKNITKTKKQNKKDIFIHFLKTLNWIFGHNNLFGYLFQCNKQFNGNKKTEWIF